MDGATPTVQVKAQPNILPLVVTQVADGTLRVHAKEGYHTDVPVEVDITIAGIEAVLRAAARTRTSRPATSTRSRSS